MKKEIMDIICCPICKTDLELKIDNEKDNEIISGTLTCIKCKTVYPIKDAIPNLLPQQKD
jgi:uncharacterized protein YbaR (Trm112 family)